MAKKITIIVAAILYAIAMIVSVGFLTAGDALGIKKPRR